MHKIAINMTKIVMFHLCTAHCSKEKRMFAATNTLSSTLHRYYIILIVPKIALRFGFEKIYRKEYAPRRRNAASITAKILCACPPFAEISPPKRTKSIKKDPTSGSLNT